VPVLVIVAVPISAARYSLPALAPFCLLMGLIFAGDAFDHPRWLGFARQPFWESFGRKCVLLVVVGALIGFPIAAKVARKREKVKSIAAEVNGLVPPNEILYALNPGYQPFLFYARAHVTYVESLDQVPNQARYLLVRPSNEEQVLENKRWAPGRPQLLSRITDYRNDAILIFEIVR